jgi:hypothetical protein
MELPVNGVKLMFEAATSVYPVRSRIGAGAALEAAGSMLFNAEEVIAEAAGAVPVPPANQ